MMNVMLLTAVLAQLSDVSVQAQGRRAGGEWELAITGKGRSLPDESVVGLRFRRIVNRAEWPGREIETRALDRAWGRSASVDRGSFHHRERLAAPGPVEVQLSLHRNEEAPPETLTKILRVASVPDLLAALRADAKRMGRALEEARALLDEVAAGKGRAVRDRLDRARAAAQEEASSSLFSATADLLDRFLADLDGASAERVSAVTGERFGFDAARASLEGIGEIAARERQLALVGEAAWVAHEIARLAESGDARKWARAEPALGKGLKALEETSRAGRSDEMALLLANLEMSYSLASSRLGCTPSDSPEWEKLQHELIRGAALLEESIRDGS